MARLIEIQALLRPRVVKSLDRDIEPKFVPILEAIHDRP
jgi:hypothetical protein